jgi:hypothetical protein
MKRFDPQRGVVMERTTLSQRMHALAATGHIKADELRSKADALDAAANGFYGEPQTVDVRQFMGAYARARLAWCDASGESLMGGISKSKEPRHD